MKPSPFYAVGQNKPLDSRFQLSVDHPRDKLVWGFEQVKNQIGKELAPFVEQTP